ncbi:MAG: hypothetical protein ACRDRK_24055 [Pseudonocardia sp.]
MIVAGQPDRHQPDGFPDDLGAAVLVDDSDRESAAGIWRGSGGGGRTATGQQRRRGQPNR